jgi:Acetyltransferase (GNAT) domain
LNKSSADPENGTVVGYAIERAFGHGSVVGPVVAATEPDAIAFFNALRVRASCALTGRRRRRISAAT